MFIYFIVFQEAVILSAIRSNLFENFLYEIEATKQKKIKSHVLTQRNLALTITMTPRKFKLFIII